MSEEKSASVGVKSASVGEKSDRIGEKSASVGEKSASVDEFVLFGHRIFGHSSSGLGGSCRSARFDRGVAWLPPSALGGRRSAYGGRWADGSPGSHGAVTPAVRSEPAGANPSPSPGPRPTRIKNPSCRTLVKGRRFSLLRPPSLALSFCLCFSFSLSLHFMLLSTTFCCPYYILVEPGYLNALYNYAYCPLPPHLHTPRKYRARVERLGGDTPWRIVIGSSPPSP